MSSSRKNIDIEKSREQASELVLLGSAQQAGIFEALVEEKDIASLKGMLHANERALRIVLEALCSLDLAKKRKDTYVLTEKARSLFIERGEDYVGGFLPHFLHIMKAWLALPEIIRGAKPSGEGPRDIKSFMNAMASTPESVVRETVTICLERKREARKVIDLGGGPGMYVKAFIEKGLDAVLYDMPDAIDYVSTAFGLKDVRNLALKRGDFTEAGFAKEFAGEVFDIVFLGNVFHIYSEEENRNLLHRVRTLLRQGGLVAIQDFVRGRSPMAEMFAVNMLANTEGGNTYTEAQYRAWLKEAGFGRIEVADIDEKDRQLITAFLE